MITISLCMIVKNEEAVLGRCLDSVKNAVDEIIIMDTGSTDDTKKIALEYTDKVYDFEWIDDFSAARNAAFSKATMDYQMWLDADDVVPEKSVKEILKLKETAGGAVDIYTMKYFTHFDLHGNPVLISTRERLTRREKNYLWQDPIHECIPLIGSVEYTEIEIHHRKIAGSDNPNRNIDIYNALESSGKTMSPRQLYYFARELKDHAQWAKAAYYFEKFLDTGQGWGEDNIASCYSLSICYDRLGDQHKILPALFKSFNYDAPRSEVCSEAGYYYKRQRAFALGLKWFSLAADIKNPNSAGFILYDYYSYIPNIEACVCSSELGDFKSAWAFNEKAAEFKPQAAAIDINRKYLASVMK